jgi:MSHA biogenesis protein MshI
MLSLWRRSPDASGQIGIHRSSDGLAVAQVGPPKAGGRPALTYCYFDESNADDALARNVRRLPNRKLRAVSVLPTSSYNMLLVEAPDVAQDELRVAVRWRIKDLIDFHIDDAVIDVFQMPRHGRGGPNQMLYAVAAREQDIRKEIAAANEAGLGLEVIDTLELCLRNIALLLEEDSRGVALMYLGDSAGVLLLVKQGVLYLTRRLETGARSLADATALRTELVAGLALEIRRSLDYFESHYEQDSIPVLYTCGLESWDQDQLTQDLSLSVRNVDIAAMLETNVALDDIDTRRCLPAIGAALRVEPVTL